MNNRPDIDMASLPDCPLCHGAKLSLVDWYSDEGEIDAVECDACLCAAPLTSWLARGDAASPAKVTRALAPTGGVA